MDGDILGHIPQNGYKMANDAQLCIIGLERNLLINVARGNSHMPEIVFSFNSVL